MPKSVWGESSVGHVNVHPRGERLNPPYFFYDFFPRSGVDGGDYFCQSF